MVERIRDLLRRFPEDEKAVKALIAADQEFGSLCQEYDEITKGWCQTKANWSLSGQ